MSHLEESLLELIRRSASELTDDVVSAIDRAYKTELDGTRGHMALATIRDSIRIAFEESLPLTQHTSSIQFYLRTPQQFDLAEFEAAAADAVTKATKLGLLEPNLIDPVTSKIFKANVGPGSPVCCLEPEQSDQLQVRLILNGDGGQLSGAQYSIPDEEIGAEYDLSGVRRAALSALIKAQGRGCGPGVIGVGIGGDRANGYALARRQLLRPLDDRNRTKVLAQLEKRIEEDANSLGIGPMGFGGKNTLLGVKVAAVSSPRHTCFVSIVYTGWAYRRQGIELTKTGEISSWLYPVTYREKAALRSVSKTQAKTVKKAATKTTKAAKATKATTGGKK